ncbi:MAG: DNA-3-methyladenine glycosylase [Micromonosporaceae bacterium]|nr:DNA-3-methyladenine glycosylase [Micromonosporaceae bacterium]
MRFLAGPVVPAARSLLGCLLVGGGVTLRLTEVEAYAGTGEDEASHAHRGRTPRNAVMFGPAGYAYVYFTYGMHWCLNVVTGPVGTASAVLLRAGSIVDGVSLARARRPASTVDRDLARGPARLTQALGVDGTATGTSMVDGTGPLLLRPAPAPVDEALVRAGPRVGVAGAHDRPWRFWLAGEPSVSAYRRQAPRATGPRGNGSRGTRPRSGRPRGSELAAPGDD